MYRFATIFLVAILATSLPVAGFGVVGGPAEPSGDAVSSADTRAIRNELGESTSLSTRTAAVSTVDDPITRTVELRHLPERPGTFEAEVTFDVPDRVTRLEIDLDRGAEVVETRGFDRADEGVYEWTAEDSNPRIRYTMPANETDRDGDHSTDDGHSTEDGHSTDDGHTTDDGGGHRASHDDDEGYYFVDTGEWGVVSVPKMSLAWSYTGSPVATERTVEVDGPGATGGEIAYFGEVAEHAREVRGERLRLVVPEATDLRESPDAILDSLGYASEHLRIGSRNEEVFVVAVPADDVEWAARGIQYGDDDAWVVDDARLDATDNVWIHEYAHARQDFTRSAVGTESETRWLTEAQAEYYAALLTLEQGDVDYGAFERDMRGGQRSPYGDSVLAEPGTWSDPRVDYVKGPLVLGALDRRIRLETDGERTLQDVFRRLNLREERVTEAAFLSTVESVSGPEAREFARRYTRTREAPETWSHAEHRAAFDQSTPAFEYAIDPDGGFTVSGPYRDAAFDAVPAVVPGETIAFSVTVENGGDRSGRYDATLQVDGRLVDSRDGSLEAGDRRTEVLEWAPEKPGRYAVTVGNERTTVTVRRLGTGTVTDFEVDPDRVGPNQPVTATATVTNDADVPAEATVRFRTPSGVAEELTVALAPGETTTVEATLSFDEPGRYEVAAGDHGRTVTVERGQRGAELVDAADEIPGFGAGAALAAVLVALAAAFARRR